MANDFDALIANEFSVIDLEKARYECTPHRGLIVRG
jgi:hypothetical protein